MQNYTLKHRATTRVNLDNLLHNFTEIKINFPEKKILALVKNNAYGHHLLTCAKTLENADFLGVADATEAYNIRNNDISTPIIVMSGIWTHEEFFEGINQNIYFMIYEPHQITTLLNNMSSCKNPFSIWIKVDTGMNRLGIPLHMIRPLLNDLHQQPNIKSITIATHYSDADKKPSEKMNSQIKQWKSFVEHINHLSKVTALSCGNSSTLLNYPEAAGDIIRPGLMLYGVSPLKKSPIKLNLKPVMTFQTTIISIKQLNIGDTVGYGSRWKATKPSTIAIARCGYGDGYDRFAKDGTPILVNDQLATIVGRVSMNMTTIDISNLNNVSIGDTVTFWGNNLPIETIETFNQSSSYDMLISAGSKTKTFFIQSTATKRLTGEPVNIH